jgi:hypothetical protein
MRASLPYQSSRVPPGQDSLPFLRIVVPAPFVLLKEADGVHPAERSDQDFKIALSRFDTSKSALPFPWSLPMRPSVPRHFGAVLTRRPHRAVWRSRCD